MHDGHEGGGQAHDHQSHHAQMVADFRRRFWVCLILTFPVLLLAPMIQGLLGLREALAFTGDKYVQFALASVPGAIVQPNSAQVPSDATSNRPCRHCPRESVYPPLKYTSPFD